MHGQVRRRPGSGGGGTRAHGRRRRPRPSPRPARQNRHAPLSTCYRPAHRDAAGPPRSLRGCHQARPALHASVGLARLLRARQPAATRGEQGSAAVPVQRAFIALPGVNRLSLRMRRRPPAARRTLALRWPPPRLPATPGCPTITASMQGPNGNQVNQGDSGDKGLTVLGM